MLHGKAIFVDTEANPETGKVRDYGAVSGNGETLHSASPARFGAFLEGADYLIGHNIVEADLPLIGHLVQEHCPEAQVIDTLYLSPLMFPKKPYHRLLKDDKLQTEQLNNPVNDALKCRDLFADESEALRKLPEGLASCYAALLRGWKGFDAFFSTHRIPVAYQPEEVIRTLFRGRICSHADLSLMIRKAPRELAYTLALLFADHPESVTPPWVMRRYPRMDNIMKLLRGTPCLSGCPYCNERLDVRQGLRRIFGFDSFRTYEGEPLQEKAAAAAVGGQSLLAVFPTGGGKSVTFQLPALMAGETSRGLTVVLSPLQSLMKDQVDHLEERGITEAVTINGLQDPIERRNAVERVSNGSASILYISPESLRSSTVETLLTGRNVVRFVIDEAHCFSAWGQDFRVDYLYIGDFIRHLQEIKGLNHAIPVSCFTATAKQKVISDICAYFREKLGLELQLFTTGAIRKNLRYAVLYKENDAAKYQEIRNLIRARNCPAIVYVSRVKRTLDIAGRLRKDGIAAEPYNGRMEATEKIRIQDDFLADRTQVIVATSAFGMGVDKKDVGLVIHYDISDSLENYVQEAGRAGRDEHLDAECFVLFNEEDLDKHFILLNQTRLTINEINQVWKAVKAMTGKREEVNCSALEIARQAGWDEVSPQMETRVTSAIAALEQAGYLERGRNVPHVYADSILVPDMQTAVKMLEKSTRLNEKQKETSRRIMTYLISRRNTHRTLSDAAESRVDYLADRLGLSRHEVVDHVLLMREEGLLADHMDLTARLDSTDNQNRSEMILKRFLRLEAYLMERLTGDEPISYRIINDQAIRDGIRTSTIRQIKTIVLIWTLLGEFRRQFNPDEERVRLERAVDPEDQRRRFRVRAELTQFIIRCLYEKSRKAETEEGKSGQIVFSVRELQQAFERDGGITDLRPSTADIQTALLYLSKIQAMILDGGFLVSYNAMQIHRKEMNNRIQYKQEDYRLLDEFYRQRIQQIHIVGEYAHLMVRDYGEAQTFVRDYFSMDYRGFIAKYFKGNRASEINRNITPERYEKLFGDLSPIQRQIIENDSSPCIVVAAGPGSGKTRVLVHKLAALLTMDDVKHDQLLMLTFSRAAATEFKKRLLDLIGGAAYFVQIRTFHSFCFELLGRMGTLTEAAEIIPAATRMILSGEVEPGQVTKTVLVVDEAQDMDEEDYRLLEALRSVNENLRIIAVGDDDQNIYSFRGSSADYLRKLASAPGSVVYEMTDNYSSDRAVVAVANAMAAAIQKRMKSESIRGVPEAEGSVTFTLSRSPRLEIPAVEEILTGNHPSGLCVLTQTNESAANVTSMLRHSGVPARLIQSNDGFSLMNLAEIRAFLEMLGEDGEQNTYAEERWKTAREKLRLTFARSTCLPMCEALLNAYEAVNRYKYRTDFIEYLSESKAEDYLDTRREEIIVSTIHQAKGKEFDHVILLLNNGRLVTDEDKRAVYVGMTRARHTLSIYSAAPLPIGSGIPGLILRQDDAMYGEPEKLLLPLTHRDVNLGFFLGKTDRILQMCSGDPLYEAGEGLAREAEYGSELVVRFSAACRERLSALRARGYVLEKADVRFVVFWKDGATQEETAIVLPNLTMTLKAPGFRGIKEAKRTGGT